MTEHPPVVPLVTPAELLGANAAALAVFDAVLAAVSESGPVEVRTSKSQIAFRRSRGFAYLWVPAQYLGDRAAGIVVLSIALGRHDDSPRFKEVNHVAPAHWMHHIEVRDADEIDEEVIGWLREAAGRAG